MTYIEAATALDTAAEKNMSDGELEIKQRNVKVARC